MKQHVLLLAAVVALLSACGPVKRSISLKVTPSMPPAPLYEPFPLRAAFSCPPELRDHRSIGTEQSRLADGTLELMSYDLDFGNFHCRLFGRVLRSVFASVEATEAAPAGDIDVVLQPAVEKASYGGGVEIRYALTLAEPGGRVIATVRGGAPTPAYKPEERLFDLAVRDAVAELLLRLEKDEDLAAWLAARSITWGTRAAS